MKMLTKDAYTNLKSSYEMCNNIFMTYRSFALRMYSKNCKERSGYNMKPYNSFTEYEKENRSFLKEKYATDS